MESKKVSKPYLSLEGVQSGVKGYPIQYAKQMIAGQFQFKMSSKCKRHCILLASRFNKNSREENGPFPGWFIQVVGDRLSIGIGNGRTWLSVQSAKPVQKDRVNLVHFSLNNETKQVVLGLNHQFSVRENVVFRCPVGYLTVGALNMRGEFRFDGELQNVCVGTALETHLNGFEQDVKCDVKRCVETSHEMLDKIEKNLQNMETDIASLRDVKNRIDSWKLRGLQLDTSLLENQIHSFVKSKEDFTKSLVEDANLLNVLNHKVNSGEVKLENAGDVFKFYKETMRCLHKDVMTLDNVVTELMQFRELGVELGTAFDSIQKQRADICDKVRVTTRELKKYEKSTREMMDVVQLEE